MDVKVCLLLSLLVICMRVKPAKSDTLVGKFTDFAGTMSYFSILAGAEVLSYRGKPHDRWKK